MQENFTIGFDRYTSRKFMSWYIFLIEGRRWCIEYEKLHRIGHFLSEVRRVGHFSFIHKIGHF